MVQFLNFRNLTYLFAWIFCFDVVEDDNTAHDVFVHCDKVRRDLGSELREFMLRIGVFRKTNVFVLKRGRSKKRQRSVWCPVCEGSRNIIRIVCV